MEVFLFSLHWNSRFEHGSAIVHNIFAYFTLSLSVAQVYMIQERCWFSQINFFMEYFPHRINVLFLSSQFLCHPQTQIRIILFHDVQRDIRNLELSPNHVSKRSSQIAFPITVLPKDDRSDFAQEERLGLPYWTIISAICVVVDESKCLDIPILEFSIIFEHLPFYLGKSRYCVSCLSCATWQSENDIHDFYCCHLWCWWSLFGEYCIRFIIISHNIASEYTSTFVFLALCLQFGILQKDRCRSVKQNELRRPTSLLHRSPLCYFWFLSNPTLKSFQVSPILYPLLLVLRVSTMLAAWE